MQIKDDWELVDGITGLKLKVVSGRTLDHLHIESIKRDEEGMPEKMNRDFWFTKDGRFYGTGSQVAEPREVDEEARQPPDC